MADVSLAQSKWHPAHFQTDLGKNLFDSSDGEKGFLRFSGLNRKPHLLSRAWLRGGGREDSALLDELIECRSSRNVALKLA